MGLMQSVRSAALALTAVGVGAVLTACSGTSNAARSASQTTTTATAITATTTPAQPAAGGSQSSTQPKSPQKSATAKPAGPGDCSAKNSRVTATAVRQPINHVLLTVKDTGTQPCTVYFYPSLKFDPQQSQPTAFNQDSSPQVIITIAPGKSAYASITTSAANGSGSKGSRHTSVQLRFLTSATTPAAAAAITVALPYGTYVDASAKVSYWQLSEQAALSW